VEDTSSFLDGFTLFSLNDLPVSISPPDGYNINGTYVLRGENNE
jgi:hypothetical protein